MYTSEILPVDSVGISDFKIYYTDCKSEADLVVYVTNYRQEALGKEEIWHFTEYRSEAGAKVFVTENRSEADLIVYRSSYKSEAGWIKAHPLQGKLH